MHISLNLQDGHKCSSLTITAVCAEDIAEVKTSKSYKKLFKHSPIPYQGNLK